MPPRGGLCRGCQDGRAFLGPSSLSLRGDERGGSGLPGRSLRNLSCRAGPCLRHTAFSQVPPSPSLSVSVPAAPSLSPPAPPQAPSPPCRPHSALWSDSPGLPLCPCLQGCPPQGLRGMALVRGSDPHERLPGGWSRSWHGPGPDRHRLRQLEGRSQWAEGRKAGGQAGE